jgi:hypothetical protein
MDISPPEGGSRKEERADRFPVTPTILIFFFHFGNVTQVLTQTLNH